MSILSTEQKEIIKENIKRAESKLTSANNAITKGRLKEGDYILMSGILALDPFFKKDEQGRERTTTQIKFNDPWSVRRFSKKNAYLLADTIKNGAGENAKVFLWIDVVVKRIEEHQGVIEQLKKILNQSV